MRFSVIIPAHNSASFISQCLSSIKAQTFNDYEVIVVCDDCTDNTAEIAEAYGATIVKTVVRNSGLARNAGIEVAKGDYLLFIDSDDWWISKDTFQIINDNLDDCDILAFGFRWKGVGDQGPRSPKGPIYPHVTNKCWTKEIIGDTRFPNKHIAPDAIFHEMMMRKKPKIKFIDDVLYYYNYLREGSISQEAKRTISFTKRYWGIK